MLYIDYGKDKESQHFPYFSFSKISKMRGLLLFVLLLIISCGEEECTTHVASTKDVFFITAFEGGFKESLILDTTGKLISKNQVVKYPKKNYSYNYILDCKDSLIYRKIKRRTKEEQIMQKYIDILMKHDTRLLYKHFLKSGIDSTDAKVSFAFSELESPILKYDSIDCSKSNDIVSSCFTLDQKSRKINSDLNRKEGIIRMIQGDRENLVQLENIFYSCGYEMLYTDSILEMVSTMYLHYPIEFQKKYLHILRIIAKGNDHAKKQVAYFTDRIMIKQSGIQIFGTQYEYQNGNKVLSQLKNINCVDSLRRQYGLDSLEGYLKKNEILFQ